MLKQMMSSIMKKKNTKRFIRSIHMQRKIEVLSLDGFNILDCPGLDDTDEQFRIINSYNISQSLNQYQYLGFIIVIDSQNKQSFVKNFKETFKYLRVFGQGNFQKEEFKPLFILTFIEPNTQGQYWIDNYCKNERNQKTKNHNDNQKFLKEFEIFFQAFDDERIIVFPSPKCNFQLSNLRDKVITIRNNLQQSFQNNTFKLDQSEINKQELIKFENILLNRLKLSIDFLFKKLLTSIIMNKEITIKQKKIHLTELVNYIELNQDKGIYNFFKQITDFGLENNYLAFFQYLIKKYLYLVSCLELQRFENFDNGFRVVSINYQTYIDDCVKQVRLFLPNTKVAKLIRCGIISLLFIPQSYTLMIPLLLQILIFSATSREYKFQHFKKQLLLIKQ